MPKSCYKAPEFVHVNDGKIVVCSDYSTTETAIACLYADGGVVAMDIETTGLIPQKGAEIVGVAMSNGAVRYYVEWNTETKRAFSTLWSLFDRLLFHNATFDLAFFFHLGFPCPATIDDTLLLGALDDTKRLSFMSKTGVGLDGLGQELLGVGKGEAQDALAEWCKEHGPALLEMEDNRKISGWRRAKTKWKSVIEHAPVPLVADYVQQDVDLPLRLLAHLRPHAHTYELEQEMIPLVVEMEAQPKWLDLPYMAVLEAELLEEEAWLMNSLDFSPFSPKQVAHQLFEVEALPILSTTPTGLPSTDKIALMRLAPISETTAVILEARRVSKIRTTYMKAFREHSTDDGRLYPRFLSWATQTGRFSSRSPNFQNVPRDPRVRNMVVAPPGHIMLLIDYAQIEPRLMAHFGRAKSLIDGYVRGDDVYGIIAKKIFPSELAGVEANDVKAERKDLRQVSKVAVLAVCYGAQAKRLKLILLTQANTDYTQAKCKRLLWAIRKGFPSVFEFIGQHSKFVKQKGVIQTAFGRERQLGKKYGGAGVRDAFNTLVQGTAADVLKKAMLRCRAYIKQHSLHTRMIMTVHDEIGFYMPYDETHHICHISDVMSDNDTFRVPLLAEPSIALRWGDKEELPSDRSQWAGLVSALIEGGK